MKKIKTALVLASLLCGCILQAQSLSPQVLSNAGKVSNAKNMSLTWTMGEAFVSTHFLQKGSLTEGFNQPTLTVTNLQNNLVKNIDVQVYPNPVRSILSIKLTSSSNEVLSLTLTDLMGRQVLSRKVTSSDEFDIQLEHLPASIYVLQLTDERGNRIGTHSISKVQ